MQTLIKPSAMIRQDYNAISKLCKETKEPVFLTKNGEGDLVVMDIEAYDQRECQLDLREKLLVVEQLRQAGAKDKPARQIGEELKAMIKGN